ncbi:hypothetical protein [Mycobacterium sp. AT1]|uniref:hypothetical protein n=1 Tax=Mycobacterium sp. AT1 TaxID=1961706 RepID=UPI0009D3EF61|nr:hypothetical protein [Mycobacterium sp. AT1]OPX06965.1 hypothetical protein B1790_25375 [Mycobacterium sp. AT1]
MPISHRDFNEQVVTFATDVENAITALRNDDWQVEAGLASQDSDRLRAVVDGSVQLRATGDNTVLAELSAVYKLCVDSFSHYLAVEHSSFVLKAKLDRAPIIRWEYDRDARSKPSSHIQ